MENESGKTTENRDLLRKLREKSMHDVLKLSIKRGPLGGYKAEDVVSYSQNVLNQWTVCEKNYNDYIKDLYNQIEKLQEELLVKECASQSAVEQRFNLLEEEVQQKAEEMARTITALEAKLLNTQTRLKSICALYDAQTLELELLKSENQRLTEESDNSSAKDANPQQAVSEEELLELLTELESLQARNTEQSTQLTELRVDRARLESAVERLEREKSGLEDALKLSEAEKSSLDESIAVLTDEKAQVQISFDAQSVENSDLRAVNETLAAENADMSMQIHTLREENSRLVALLEELSRQNEDTCDKLSAEQAQSQSLNEQYQAQVARIDELEAALKEAKSAPELLPHAKAADNTQLLTLVRGNKELIHTIKAMAVQNQELQVQMNAIKESFQKILRLESEKQIENEQLQQLLTIERTRIRQLVRESWKTSLWNEVNSMLM